MSDIGLDMLGDDAAPEKGREDNTNPNKKEEPLDALGHALGALPESVQLRIATMSARYGIDPKSDPIHAVVESMQLGKDCAMAASEGAVAAGQAARAVQAGVASIPDQILSGAIKAGDEVKGALRVEIRERAVEAGQALKMLIDSAASKGATDLKSAASELDIKLGKIPGEVQKSLDDYKKNGVADFARAAANAGKAAAETALWAQISRSALVSVLAFLIAGVMGATGLWGYLLLTHRVMPTGVIAMQYPLSGTTVVKLPDGAIAKVNEPIPLIP